LPEVNHAIMEQVQTHFKPNFWALLLFDEVKKQLRFELVVGENTQHWQGSWAPSDKGVLAEVFQSGKPFEAEGGIFLVEGERRLQVEQAILAPLSRADKRLGVLVVSKPAAPMTLAERTLMFALCDFAAVAIENARALQRVRELSVTDDVTSLYNARFLEQALEQEFSRSKRAGSPISVIFLDLDYFKQINDRYGHLVGSEVLRETANILRQSLRATDIATRYGGDEFVLILPDTSQSDALRVAERCREAMRAHTFGSRHGVECKITASFGVATIPDDTNEKMDLIRLADQAMYYVKEHNRDNVATASQSR
jgi:diguanylate cyclase (GGDEF)-like protein